MIFLRVRKRSKERRAEWFTAANIFGFGLTLLAPGFTFSSPSYVAFMLPGRTLEESEFAWGCILATLGAAWLVGLFINGARQRTTMHIRAICGLGGFVILGMLSLGFLLPYLTFLFALSFGVAVDFLLGRTVPLNAVYLSTGFWNYFTISLLCLWNLYAGLTEPVEGHGKA